MTYWQKGDNMDEETLLKEMDDKITQFCHSSPAPGFELDYLGKAAELRDIYAQARILLSEHEEKEAQKELQKLCQKARETATISPKRGY